MDRRIHDDSGQGDTTGRLPCELDDTYIPERKTDTAEPAMAQSFIRQGWPKFDGVEKCKNRSAMGLCKKEYLRIVVRGHDDSGQDIASDIYPSRLMALQNLTPPKARVSWSRGCHYLHRASRSVGPSSAEWSYATPGPQWE